jgi:hypothetical protein
LSDEGFKISPLGAFLCNLHEKYRYGENSAANPNLKKKLFNTLKAQTFF